VIYLDSSALVKLAFTEPETDALADYLAKRAGQALVSSSLHRAEVLRAIWLAEPGALPRAQRIIRRVSLVSLSHDLLDNAATQAPSSLPTSAAIHLASAMAVKRDLTAFVAYDPHLLEAAEAAGLPVASPALPAMIMTGLPGNVRGSPNTQPSSP
jgi:uncharacterized protein